MKKLYSGALIFHLMVEWLAAGTLIGTAGSMFGEGQGAAIMWAQMYGFAALAAGTLAIWAWPHRGDSKVTGTVLGILTTFHISISAALALSGEMMGALALHSLMAVVFVFLYLRRATIGSDQAKVSPA